MKKLNNLQFISIIIGLIVSLIVMISTAIDIRNNIITKKDLRDEIEKINKKLDTNQNQMYLVLNPLKKQVNDVKRALSIHIVHQQKYTDEDKIFKDSLYYQQKLILNGISEKKNFLNPDLTQK